MKGIEIRCLTKRFSRKGRPALDDLSLAVSESCIFGLIGPNGAGKSTTLNILAGLLPRDGGEISILGEKIRSADYSFKKYVGFALERPVYFEKLSAVEYLHFAAAMHGIGTKESDKHIKELLEFFDLQDNCNEWIDNYSAGMKKKVSLAAAIIHRPNLLILDDPLEGIDPISARLIEDNLRLMADRDTTVLLSSHVLETVEKLCDEVAIINKGKLIFQSMTRDLRKRIKNEVNQETYASLEELFIDVVSKNGEVRNRKKLSWL